MEFYVLLGVLNLCPEFFFFSEFAVNNFYCSITPLSLEKKGPICPLPPDSTGYINAVKYLKIMLAARPGIPLGGGKREGETDF